MSSPGSVTLLNLITQAQLRADMINSSYVAQYEWAVYLNTSYKELYDLLVSAYGTDYPGVWPPYSFQTIQNQQTYTLPDGFSVVDALTSTVRPAFYKMLGLDLQLAGTANSQGVSDSNVTLKPFTFAERNRYSVPNFQSFYGVTNIRYRIYGNQIWLTPIPNANQIFQLYYVPEPTSLVTQFLGFFQQGSGNETISPVSDTSNLAVGMTVSNIVVNGVTQPIVPGSLISSISPGTNVVLNTAFNSIPSVSATVYAYNLNGTFDGIAGWEEYVVIDAAIKALTKEETPCPVLMEQKEALRVRIMAMANNRDAGSPATVSDTQFNDFGWGSGNTSGSGTW